MSRFILFIVSFVLVAMTMVGCQTQPESSNFVTVEDGKFIKDGKPYSYIGTNYWYGGSLAADTVGGDRQRLIKELNFMKSQGIDNLRVMVGAEGSGKEFRRVTPTTITAPGIYNDVMLEGLDFFLNELRKRDMVAVLFLTNNWEWSGGMAQYVNWNGYGDYVNPNLEKYSWSDFFDYQNQFYSCEPCKQQLEEYISFIVNRTNTVNGIKYINDPSIMAWELANEPRPMAEKNADLFKEWVKSTSELIKSIDPNHLVTTGSEGEAGSNDNIQLFKESHNIASVDYLTFHIWAKNWKWYDHHNPDSTLPLALIKMQKYIDDHIKVAEQLNKPLVLEEFGLARDHEEFMLGTPTQYRDAYYNYAFDQVNKSVLNNKPLVAANFWAFGGFAEPIEGQTYWKLGDKYSGDPPMEEQGLNSVFASDKSTLEIIKKYNKGFNRVE